MGLCPNLSVSEEIIGMLMPPGANKPKERSSQKSYLLSAEGYSDDEVKTALSSRQKVLKVTE